MSETNPGTVYLYEPAPQPGVEYFSDRNVGLAKYLASITTREFGGEFNAATAEIPDDAFWFLHGPIPPEEAAQLEITGRNFFGGITDLLHAQKSVFHTPVPGAETIPDNFPSSFVEYLDKNKVLLPGYTAFSAHDAHTACDLLAARGYVPRFKDPLMSASKGQYRLESHDQLVALLEAKDEAALAQCGVVIEANMIGKADGELDSLSGGWVEIDGRTNTSVGFMTFAENITPFSIISSDRFVIRGDDPRPFLGLVDERYHGEAELLSVFRDANLLIPELRATRRNYNFIQGSFERSDGTPGETALKASEPTFRPGGATGAELLARDYLDKHPESDVVHVKCEIHYGDRSEIKIPEDAIMIHEGGYEGPGRYDKHISVATQVFAQVIDASR
jgi:hypothetical protein